MQRVNGRTLVRRESAPADLKKGRSRGNDGNDREERTDRQPASHAPLPSTCTNEQGSHPFESGQVGSSRVANPT